MKSTLKLKGFSIGLAILIMATVGNLVSAHADPPKSPGQSPNFGVEFTDCVESIGVTLVPTAIARAYVPSQFILVGEGQAVTPLVVRTARCRDVATAGHKATPTEIVQIGAVIIPPDFTGDINNYTIWYQTSDGELATNLRRAGVNAQLVPTIDYRYRAGANSFSVRVPMPGAPRLELSGAVQPSPNAAGSFLANWWQQTDAGIVKMSTNVPVIKIGGADLTLTTDLTGRLGQLIGGSSTGFPLVQQFNTFSTAHMEVTKAASVTITFPSELNWGPPGTPLPPGAFMVSPAALAEFAAQEGFQFITRAGIDTAAEQTLARTASAKKLVEDVASASPSLAYLRPDTPRESDTLHRKVDGDYLLTRGGGNTILHGTDWLYQETASSLFRTTSRQNREADFRSLIDILPGDQRTGLPAVSDLTRLTDGQLADADGELVRRVEAFSPNEPFAASASSTGNEPSRNDAAQYTLTALSANDSSDLLLYFPATGCGNHEPNNLYAQVDWPMKAYTTRPRDQRGRGTCVAHSIIAALETRIFLTRGLRTDYSEQELYAVAKGRWFPTADAYGDGLHTESVLDELESHGYRIDAESGWPYNNSWCRFDDEDTRTYLRSCLQLDADGQCSTNQTEYCSDTNHQMKVICTVVDDDTVCGTKLPPAVSGGGLDPVKLTGWVSLWNSFEPENSLASIRAHLNAGHPVVLSVNTDSYFHDAAYQEADYFNTGIGPGVVYQSEGSESGGGHAIAIVGYIPNAQLPPYISAPNGSGGGYLIAKNSWGCWGDGGYMYLSYNWVIDQTKSAHAITSLATTATAPSATLSVDKSYLTAPGHVNFTVSVNSSTKKVEIFRGLGKDHKILTKNFAGGQSNVATAIDGFIDSGQNGVYIYWARVTDQFGNLAASNKVGVLVAIDDQNPQVQLTAESTNVSTPGAIHLHATASDNVGVARVKFYRGFQLIGEDTTAPYSADHTVLSSDFGTWPYVAVVFDAAGNAKMSNVVSITATSQIQLKPKILSFTASPTSVPAGGAALLSWNVSGATTVSISQGIGVVASQGSFPVAITQSTAYVLFASNSAGLTTAAIMVVVTASPPPPAFTLSASPMILVAPGSTTLTASTTVAGAVRVEFLRAGVVIANDTSPSDGFTATVDFARDEAGMFPFTAKAYDAGGNSFVSNVVIVTVRAPV